MRWDRAFVSRSLVCALVAALAPAFSQGASSLRPEEASLHIGEEAEVCGVVASATYATRSNGEPTFLNLGKAFPNHIFTALIWGSDRTKFSYRPESLNGERICVTGLITKYDGKPQIIVSRATQIRRPSAD